MKAPWSGAGSPGLPLRRGGEMRLLLWAFALMSYVAGLGAVGLLAVGRSDAVWRRTAAAAMTLELPAETSPARLAIVLALLRQTPGILGATALSAADTARLLQPWVGPGAQLDGLPLPQLVDVRADPAVAIDFAALRGRLATIVPQAVLDDNQAWLRQALGVLRPLRLVLAGWVAAGLLAMAPAAAFAARQAAGADWALIALAHLLGAEDRAVIRPFVWRALRLGLAGGALGTAAVLATLVSLGPLAAALRSLAPVDLNAGDWRNWVILAAIVLGNGLIAASAAQAGLRRRLAALP